MKKKFEKAKKTAQIMSEAVKKNVRRRKGRRKSQDKIAVEGGYSESYAKTGRFKKTEVWGELMKEYLPNSKLAKLHGDLLESSHIQHYIFPKIRDDVPVEEETTDETETKKKKKGKKKTRVKDTLTKKEIKEIVESVPGCKLIYVKDDKYTGKIAFFQAPDSKSRSNALDMAYKVRGNYMAEKENNNDPLDDLSNAQLAELEKNLIKKLRGR